jgi:hypothetical protein
LLLLFGSIAATIMKCDRLLKDISGSDLQLIEANLPHSDVPFLKPGQHFRDIEHADQAVMKKYGLDLPSMIGKVNELISAANTTLSKFGNAQPKMSKLAGALQYVDDKATNLKHALDMIFKQPATQGVNIINCGRAPDASAWEGPDPFARVPKNPEWSSWHRRCAPVIDGDRVYMVATITWGGAQKVGVACVSCLLNTVVMLGLCMQCPFQHPDDHVIIFPGFNDNEVIMLLSDLSLHMARAHGFCGTKGAYRIDPVALANLLGCGPNNKVNPSGFADAIRAKLQEAEEELAASFSAAAT